MDISQLLYSLLLVTFLGLILSFNPMLIVVDFMLVLKSKRPIFNTIILLAGFATSVTLLFSLASLVIDPDSQFSFSQIKESLDIPTWLDIIAGSALVLYGIRRYQPIVEKKPEATLANFEIPQKPGKIYLFAVVKSFLSVSNIFAVLILAKQAVSGNWTIALSALAVIWLLLIGFLPLLYLMYMHWFKKESLAKIDTRLNDLLSRDTTNLFSHAMILVGLAFILKGATELLGG